MSRDIPSEIGELSNLKRLKPSGNKFSGEIPESFCDLSNIDYNYNGKLIGQGKIVLILYP